MQNNTNNTTDRKAYIITGPTSGIGLATAFEVTKHGTVVLVGRDREKLSKLQKALEQKGGRAVSVVCDLSDIASVRRAAAEIVALRLPIAGLLNNAGIMQMRVATKNALGWDMTFATNHLGPFALTEALVPYLPDGTNVVFIASAVDSSCETRLAEISCARSQGVSARFSTLYVVAFYSPRREARATRGRCRLCGRSRRWGCRQALARSGRWRLHPLRWSGCRCCC